MNAARTLLSRMDGAPTAPRRPQPRARRVLTTTGPKRLPRRPRAAEVAVDAESLIRGVVARLQTHGNAEAERLREAMRKAIAVLQAAVGV